MGRPLLFAVVGTRPEAIKMAPVVQALRRFEADFQTCLVSSGQHKEILLEALGAFGLEPDVDLGVMRTGQSLAGVTARILDGLDALCLEREPLMMVAQGDTTTTLVAALAAFYRHIPFAHVEAGLRTPTIDNPFPEEFNRRTAGLVASLHFPPTRWAAENLRREGVHESQIFVTGNTGIDAVLSTADAPGDAWYAHHLGRVVLLTTHRRENWGDPQVRIARAARRLVERHADTLLVVPMHPNPDVRATLRAVLGEHPRIELIEPPDYARFVKLMQRSNLILSDSGGVQEEAPAFGIPVLVLRETTERPEGVDAGTAKLVGTDEDAVFREGDRLLSDSVAYSQMAHAVSPYGDGKASARIASVVAHRLGVNTPEVPMWV